MAKHRGLRVAAVAVGTGLLALSACRTAPVRAADRAPVSPAPAVPVGPRQVAYAAASAVGPAQAATAYQEALRLIGQGELKAAEERLRQAVTANPDLADAWNDLAYVQARQTRYAEAVDSARRALALRQDFPYAQYNLGWALLGTAGWREAQAPLTATMQAQPGRPEPLWALGRWAERAGDYRAAVQAYGRAVALGYGQAAPDLAFAEMLASAEAAGAKIDPARLTRATMHLSGPGRLDQAAAWPGGLAFRAEGKAPVYLPQRPEAVPSLAPHGLGVVTSGDESWLALATKGEIQLLAYDPTTGGLRLVFRGQGDLAGFEGNDVFTAVRQASGALEVTLYGWNAAQRTFTPDHSFVTH